MINAFYSCAASSFDIIYYDVWGYTVICCLPSWLGFEYYIAFIDDRSQEWLKRSVDSALPINNTGTMIKDYRGILTLFSAG